MTMNVNKKMVARLTAAVLAATTWGAMAASANVEMRGSVGSSTCALESNDLISVDLGEASVGDFAGQPAGYAGSSAGFDLHLVNCDGVDGFGVWASGAQTESGLDNSIRNTAQAGTAATGVAMQVFYNDGTTGSTVMKPNGTASDAIVVDVASNTTHDLNFTAKMVKIAQATEPTAGDVQGAVTINVDYR